VDADRSASFLISSERTRLQPSMYIYFLLWSGHVGYTSAYASIFSLDFPRVSSACFWLLHEKTDYFADIVCSNIRHRIPADTCCLTVANAHSRSVWVADSLLRKCLSPHISKLLLSVSNFDDFFLIFLVVPVSSNGRICGVYRLFAATSLSSAMFWRNFCQTQLFKWYLQNTAL